MTEHKDHQSMELVTRAAAFAAQAHVKQLRKTGDQPYVNHVLRVSHAAALAGLSPEAVAAALLHDVVEDTDVSLDEIAKQFPPRVVTIVDLLTKWWPDDAPHHVKASEKPKYYGAILRNQEAIEVKLLDRADNLRDMIRGLPKIRSWAERYLRKTEEEIAPILAKSQNQFCRDAYSSALRDLKKALSGLDTKSVGRRSTSGSRNHSTKRK